MSKTTERGEEGFERYYERLWGSRWAPLRRALLEAEARRCVRWNGFAAREAREATSFGLPPTVLEGCYHLGAGDISIGRDAQGLLSGYVMDLGSVVAARALPLDGARDVLDMCAAPGGKSLVLAEEMEDGARLVLCDRSPERRRRLGQVLADYLPARVRERTSLVGRDARTLGVTHRLRFDAVLLDAPCSSESHVLRDAAHLREWSSGRSERLAKDQYALLTSALLALRPGGALVYATCAISRQENDGVIERLLARGRHPARVEPARAPLGEATEHGWQILPDRDGAGPIYFALLRKSE